MWEDNNPLSYGSPTDSQFHSGRYDDDDNSNADDPDNENDDSPVPPAYGSHRRDPYDNHYHDVTDPRRHNSFPADSSPRHSYSYSSPSGHSPESPPPPPPPPSQPAAAAVATQRKDAGEYEDEEDEEYRRMRREKGYSSRVEMMLLENKDVPIVICDAGKNHEGSGGFIVYTIRTGDLEVRRRYSEFESLRKNLSLLHPCLIVPPIPEKHQVSDYVTAPTSAKENVNIIDHRKRMLGVFLQRCALMKDIRYDSVFQRFLDPNASWSEVIMSAPITNLPKYHLRAPPLNPAEPTQAHQYLPIPPASAKLKLGGGSSPPHGRLPGNFGRFPPLSHNLTEGELDPYFNAYEVSTRAYEALLTGSIERVNRRILKRLQELFLDFNELGARYNAWSLSEESGDLSSAIERVGQAVDSSYIATGELARALGSSFAEPLRESAQFAGVVQKVLRYRVLKRIQEELTRDMLAQKRQLLDSLERSEMEARRIEQFLHATQAKPADSGRDADIESIDSADFPPSRSETAVSPPPPAPPAPPSSQQQQRRKSSAAGRPPAVTSSTAAHKKSSSFSVATAPPASSSSSSTNIFARGFGKLGYAIHGVVDVDPERTRRDNIGKTRELLVQLEGAEKAVEKDVEETGRAVLKDLRRFQAEKVKDLKHIMREYAKCQIEWARRSQLVWEEAEREVAKIQTR